MLHTLRTRLLLSFLVVLLITLSLIGLALLVFLRSQPLPTEDIVSQLTGTLLDIEVRDVIRVGAGSGGTLVERVQTFLVDEAALRHTRILAVTGDGVVRFDSTGDFAVGASIEPGERAPLLAAATGRPIQVFKGRFVNPDGSEWIFVSRPLRPAGLMSEAADSPNALHLVVAQPAPNTTLRQLFRRFGDSFFRPLARAGLLGLLIAAGLSALIARSVARPLQQMAAAARRIANGDFRQRVPEKGPREVRALAEAFNEMAAHVSSTQQAQRDFLANVSHDLRTPLTSIQGFSQAIAEGIASDPASARRAAQIITDEAGRLHRMVEELLDLARIEAGQMEMRRHAVSLGDVLRAVSESLSVRAREQGLALEVEIPPALPRVAGDGDRLAQVFTNLIDNAIQHTPPGGMIALRAEAAATGLVVTVRDTGEGIPAADLARIFERFYQVDKSRQREQRSGMGLGLAITRQIIEAHGGKIEVASTPGQGTIFTVWLPLPSPNGAPRRPGGTS